jgi:hypothetical protein
MKERILNTQQSRAALFLNNKDSRPFKLKLCSLHMRYSAFKFPVLVVPIYLIHKKFCPFFLQQLNHQNHKSGITNESRYVVIQG